ncbi:MAG: radical SAM protein [Armatimonadota bacterium]|nr:MAG: radical SAM protein [Armatimonadota bacterium]
MFLAPQALNAYVAVRPPDYAEERSGDSLVVWADPPYWMVVDPEFLDLLQELGGERTLRQVVETRPAWQGTRRDIARQIGNLLAAGVAADAAGHEARSGQQDAPDARIENIAVNITRQCNLRCHFCYNLHALTFDDDTELAAEEIVKFLDAARPFVSRRPSLTVLGGEPLLCPDKLLAVCRHAARHGFETLVSTNGILVSEDFARAARRIGLQVQVSLDGHRAELNDALRGAGTFDRIVRGITTLVRHRVHTIVSMVCHRDNLAYLEPFYGFAAALGVAEARFIPLKRIGGALSGRLDPVRINDLMRAAFATFEREPRYLPLTGRDAFSILANTCQYSSRRPSCGTGLQTVLLDADGRLYPCPNTNVPEFAIASIRDPDFEFAEVWQESPVLQRHRQLTDISRMNETCSVCVVRHWCLGGCRGETLATTGDLTAPAPNCLELREATMEMFWILARHPHIVGPATRVCG